jgi:hypothetical protein
MGDTRVNGSLAVGPPDLLEEKVERKGVRDDAHDDFRLEGNSDRDVGDVDDDEDFTASPDSGTNEINEEKRIVVVAGSNLQNSHLSRVEFVRPSSRPFDSDDTTFLDWHCDRDFLLMPMYTLPDTSHPPLSQVTAISGATVAFFHIE